jgi:prefoldin subunit 5
MLEDAKEYFDIKRRECKALTKELKALRKAFNELNASHESLKEDHEKLGKAHKKLEKLIPLYLMNKMRVRLTELCSLIL